MKVLVIGGGGREHALVWRLKESSRVDRVVCAPGNGGVFGGAGSVAAEAGGGGGARGPAGGTRAGPPPLGARVAPFSWVAGEVLERELGRFRGRKKGRP